MLLASESCVSVAILKERMMWEYVQSGLNQFHEDLQLWFRTDVECLYVLFAAPLLSPVCTGVS